MRVFNGSAYEDHHVIWLKCGENSRLIELLHHVVEGKEQSEEALKLARELWAMLSDSVELRQNLGKQGRNV